MATYATPMPMGVVLAVSVVLAIVSIMMLAWKKPGGATLWAVLLFCGATGTFFSGKALLDKRRRYRVQ